MSGMKVQFGDESVCEMPVNDVILLTKNLPLLRLDYVLSKEHLKKFQYFVIKDLEDIEQNIEQVFPVLTISKWKRELIDKINDYPTLISWYQLGKRANLPDLVRLLEVRGEEMAESIVEMEDEGEEEEEGGVATTTT